MRASKTMRLPMTRMRVTMTMMVAMTRAMIRMKPAVTKLEKRKKKSSLKSVTMLRQPRTKTATQKVVSRRNQLAQLMIPVVLLHLVKVRVSTVSMKAT